MKFMKQIFVTGKFVQWKMIDEADKPTLRWWAAFLLLDAEKWASAKKVLSSILSDCVNGQWPAC